VHMQWEVTCFSRKCALFLLQLESGKFEPATLFIPIILPHYFDSRVL
jgi:hypothetical protein